MGIFIQVSASSRRSRGRSFGILCHQNGERRAISTATRLRSDWILVMSFLVFGNSNVMAHYSTKFILAAALLACALLARAQNNVDASGLALQGFDPVAYFTEKKPVRGTAEFTARHEGATYRFASAANRDAFAAAPAKYAPQYGGYCAFGVAAGYKAPIEPDAWTVVDGRLYLNYNQSIRSRWSRDIPGHIRSADTNWPTVRAK